MRGVEETAEDQNVSTEDQHVWQLKKKNRLFYSL